MHLVWFIKIMFVMTKVFRGKKLPDVRHDGFESGSEISEEAKQLKKLQ